MWKCILFPVHPLSGLIFYASGFAALVYQVVPAVTRTWRGPLPRT